VHNFNVCLFVRFMGWIIRHITNRHLASESLVRSLARTTLLRLAPPEVHERILAARGERLVSTASAFGSAEAILYGQGGRVGAGAVSVHASRRNSRKVAVANHPRVMAAFRRKRGAAEADSWQGKRLLRLTNGVRIDGHRWSVGRGYWPLLVF
jgi:hypothetical protein